MNSSNDIEEQCNHVKQLFSLAISEGNKLPLEYRKRVVYECLQEMAKDNANEQEKHVISLIITCLQQKEK